jgi:hypothetical protein
MPNRKTFNSGDRFDHSSHSTAHSEPGDLGSPADARPKPAKPAGEKGKVTADRRQSRTKRSG